MREEAVEGLRGVVRDSVGKHLYASAIFLADKVAAPTGDLADVYMLAQALFLSRHFHRALHPLNSSRLLRDLRFYFLAAKCLAGLWLWLSCLQMLQNYRAERAGDRTTHFLVSILDLSCATDGFGKIWGICDILVIRYSKYFCGQWKHGVYDCELYHGKQRSCPVLCHRSTNKSKAHIKKEKATSSFEGDARC